MLNSWHFHKKEQTGWYLPCAFPSPVLSAWARGVGRAVCTTKGVHVGRTLCWTSTKLYRPVTSTTVKTWDISMTPTKLRGISINSVLHCSQYPPHAGNWGFTFCHERLVLCSVPDTRNHAVHICCAWLLSHSEPCGWDASMVVIHAFPHQAAFPHRNFLIQSSSDGHWGVYTCFPFPLGTSLGVELLGCMVGECYFMRELVGLLSEQSFHVTFLPQWGQFQMHHIHRPQLLGLSVF